jgi:hypothetical protein
LTTTIPHLTSFAPSGWQPRWIHHHQLSSSKEHSSVLRQQQILYDSFLLPSTNTSPTTTTPETAASSIDFSRSFDLHVVVIRFDKKGGKALRRFPLLSSFTT